MLSVKVNAHLSALLGGCFLTHDVAGLAYKQD